MVAARLISTNRTGLLNAMYLSSGLHHPGDRYTKLQGGGHVKFKPEQLAKADDEESHQIALMCWAADNTNVYPALRWLFAIPNGGKRDKITAARLKAQGVKAGVGDLFLMCPRNGFHGLFIEMKNGDNTLSDDQVTFAIDATRLGYKYEVCYTWEQGVTVLVDYLRSTNDR